MREMFLESEIESILKECEDKLLNLRQAKIHTINERIQVYSSDDSEFEKDFSELQALRVKLQKHYNVDYQQNNIQQQLLAIESMLQLLVKLKPYHEKAVEFDNTYSTRKQIPILETDQLLKLTEVQETYQAMTTRHWLSRYFRLCPDVP